MRSGVSHRSSDVEKAVYHSQRVQFFSKKKHGIFRNEAKHCGACCVQGRGSHSAQPRAVGSMLLIHPSVAPSNLHKPQDWSSLLVSTRRVRANSRPRMARTARRSSTRLDSGVRTLSWVGCRGNDKSVITRGNSRLRVTLTVPLGVCV